MNILKEKVDSHNIDADLCLTNNESVEMNYDPIRKSIEVNIDTLTGGSRYYDLPLNVYAEIVLCHELGHAIDKDLDKISREISTCYDLLIKTGYDEKILDTIKYNRILAEKNAWDIAGKIINNEYKGFFEVIRNDSLERSVDCEELLKQRITLLYEIAEQEGYNELLKNELNKVSGASE